MEETDLEISQAIHALNKWQASSGLEYTITKYVDADHGSAYVVSMYLHNASLFKAKSKHCAKLIDAVNDCISKAVSARLNNEVV